MLQHGNPEVGAAPLIADKVRVHRSSLRHEFYETDERLTLSVFDKGADPAQVSVKFQPRSVRFSSCFPDMLCDKRAHSCHVALQLTYEHGDKILALEPLKGQIDPDRCEYTVGKFKVEIRLAKRASGRWGTLVGDSPDRTYSGCHPGVL